MKLANGQKSRARQKGAGLMELAIVLPILLFTVMAAIDLGRLVYSYQAVNDLTREAGNLISRGTSPDAAYTALLVGEDSLDLAVEGGMVVSRVRRRSTTSGTPWITEQYRYGALGSMQSKVGSLNGAATLPRINTLDPGETITTVEVLHAFHPLFNIVGTGSALFPDTIYEASFF